MSGFKVMDRQCDQCLYSADKIVSNARRKEILREITRNDVGFLCHKASALGDDVYCAGDYEARKCGKLGRFAEWLGTVTTKVSAAEYEERFRSKRGAP